MNIKNIFSKAFYITWNNPAFWWLGIILLGGFNIQWVLSGTPFPLWVSRYQRILEWWLTSGSHFHYPPVWFFITLLAGVLILLLNGWVKALLIYLSAHAGGFIFPDQQKVRETTTIWQVGGLVKKYIGKLLFINTLVALVAGGLLVLVGFPVWGYLIRQDNLQLIAILFVFLACLIVLWAVLYSQMTVLFVVLRGSSIKDAFRTALDFMFLRWQQSLIFMLCLTGCFIASFFLGSAVFFYVRFAVKLLRGYSFEPMLMQIVTLLYLVWLALLNVFYNVVFVVFFSELNHGLTTEGQLLTHMHTRHVHAPHH